MNTEINSIEKIVKESKSYERHFPRLSNPEFYRREETALKPFQKVIEDTRYYPTIVGLPLRAKEDEIRKNEVLMRRLVRYAGNSAYFLSRMIGSVYQDQISDQVGGTHHESLILCTDDASVRTIQHEMFHFVHDQLLKETARMDIERMFEYAQDYEKLVDNRQINSGEYFAFGGEYYLTKRLLLSPERKLRKKDPKLHELIADVLTGKEELICVP